MLNYIAEPEPNIFPDSCSIAFSIPILPLAVITRLSLTPFLKRSGLFLQQVGGGGTAEKWQRVIYLTLSATVL